MNPVWYRLRQATLLLATLYSSSALMTSLALALLGLTLVAVSPASAITFTLDQTFNDPTVTGSDQFGRSVAIDGNNVLIGAFGDDTNGGSVGQAHLFTPEPSTFLLTALGLLGLGFYGGRRNRVPA